MANDGFMTPIRFRRITLGAWFLQALIVVSGAAVRLTEAGLGCEDWPTCNDEELFPEWELHGLIEFGNRVISAFVALSTVIAVVAAYKRRNGAGAPRRSDLIRYSWGLVAGTVGQVVLGGITVLADLHPIVVSVHFLLSMLLLWIAQSLWVRAGWPDETVGADGNAMLVLLTDRWPRVQLFMAGVVLLTGTIVTGTGPNSGDSRADRLSFDLVTVARVHSVSVWLLLATVVFITLRMVRSEQQSSAAFSISRLLMGAMAAQGAVGYTQFALGVPPGLVEVHVFGAIVVWSLAIAFQQRLQQPAPPGGFPLNRGDNPERGRSVVQTG